MKKQTLIFDLDGTLAHTAPDLIATLNRVSRPYDLSPVDFSVVGQIVGHGAKAMLQRVFELNGKVADPDTLSSLFDDFIKDYSDNLATESHLFDGLEELLPRLTAEGYALCVCTNKMESMARQLLEHLGHLHHFSSVTGGDTFSFRKPDPRHLARTVELAGGEIDKAIMIGDSITDIKAAQNAGIPSIAVTFGYSDVPVEELGATQIISDYQELNAALQFIQS